MAETKIAKRRYTTELPEDLALRFEAIREASLRSKPAEIHAAIKAWVEQHEEEAA